ncbi:MAG TPA: class I SAM-dependent methyltransferase [Bryobacteraceae bacterium]|nr:class I SAM-dependent methyltransferase [Bryobacteraceae bacterium]
MSRDQLTSSAHATGYRLRLFLFLTISLGVLAAMYVLYDGVNTLRRLDLVEAERNGWQRPTDVLHALNLHRGNVVVDLGSGSGYFALKMSPIVGRGGQVLAVDLRKLSLTFLSIRAAMRTPHNIRIVHAELNDPHLPSDGADAVLISNAYHEFQNPQLMLDFVYRSLHAGGRLVILDRGPSPVADRLESDHEVSLEVVSTAVSKHGFQIIGEDSQFVRSSEDGRRWWLLIARKPLASERYN